MARKPKELTEEQREAQSNSAMQSDIRRECAAEQRLINAERKELNERAGTIRERLENCGIEKKSFFAGLRTADMADAAARDEYLEGLAKTLDALGVGKGQNLDLFKHTSGAESAEDKSKAEENKEREAVH